MRVCDYTNADHRHLTIELIIKLDMNIKRSIHDQHSILTMYWLYLKYQHLYFIDRVPMGCY